MQNRINFTKKNIDALQLPEAGKRDTYHDTGSPSLQLRVTPSGAKTFSVLKRIKGGQPERVTIGSYPAMSIENARKNALKISADIAEGKNPAEVKRGLKAELTFADLFNEYLERHSKPNKKTWDEDLSKYKTYLEKPLGKKKLPVVNRKDVALIHSNITKAGHGRQPTESWPWYRASLDGEYHRDCVRKTQLPALNGIKN